MSERTALETYLMLSSIPLRSANHEGQFNVASHQHVEIVMDGKIVSAVTTLIHGAPRHLHMFFFDKLTRTRAKHAATVEDCSTWRRGVLQKLRTDPEMNLKQAK